MAYCKKCGAYIPDGQKVCLACGFDERAESERKSSAAYAAEAPSEETRRSEEEARRRTEERRRQQQELNRKWAESEQLRRRQQEDFRRSQEEAARRSAEWDSQRSMNEDGYYRLHRGMPGSESDFTRSSASSGRLFAYLSYISFLCFLPSILGVNDPFTRFHAKQGRKLFFAALVLTWIPGLNAVAWLLQVALAVIGIRNVSDGVMQELPIVGRLGEK